MQQQNQAAGELPFAAVSCGGAITADFKGL